MRRKGLKVLGLAIGMSLSMSLLSYASTFSEYWYQDTQGNWHIQDQNGNMVTNAWLCDDAVGSNGQAPALQFFTKGCKIPSALRGAQRRPAVF